MTAQEYIQYKLDRLKEPASSEYDKNMSLEDAVYSRLMSKKFRKVKAGAPCVEITKRVVAKAVKEQKPILVTECFGGNKLWRFEEAPEIDWAEVFSLIYFLEWMKYVAAVHKPGMIFDYFSQDISVERIDNVSKADLDAYNSTFHNMLEWIKPYVPENVSVQYRRHRDMLTNESEYDTELAHEMQNYLKVNNNQLPTLDEESRTRTELNVQLKEGQDKDPLWREKVEHMHRSIYSTPSFKTYAEDPDMVWTCPTLYDDSIVTGSTKKSFAKFWAAVGALERNGEKFNELVLTPKQLEKAEFDWEDLHFEGLNGKNLSRVRVLKSN